MPSEGRGHRFEFCRVHQQFQGTSPIGCSLFASCVAICCQLEIPNDATGVRLFYLQVGSYVSPKRQ